MSVSQSINGVSTPLPTTGDTDWGAYVTQAFQNLAVALSSVLTWGASGIAAGPGNYFLRPGFLNGFADTSEVAFRIPMAGRIKNLYVNALSAPTVTADVLTVRVNGVDTALSATLAVGNTTTGNISNSVVVAAGDRISLKFAAASTAHPTNVMATVAFVPS